MDKDHMNEVVYKNRYDVTVLINGLPLVQIELKRPGVEINEAINQINRYRRYSFRGLFHFIQCFVVSNSIQTKYFANENETNADGTYKAILKSLAFFWTDANNERINQLNEFTDDFFTKFNITALLTDYTVLQDTMKNIIVMRPYQIYATKAVLRRVLEENRNGYVWHTTGSGKTLTSFKCASLLRDNGRIDKVFFLVDRKDLDDQTVDEYNSFEEDCVDNTDSTAELIKRLKNSGEKMLVTTIQKLACALRNEKYKSNTLYLDKPLFWHSLVQAYSRTNRIYKETKQYGQIITFRNIKDEQDKALKLFSGDGNPNAYLLENYDYYVAEYADRVSVLRNIAPSYDIAGRLQSEDDQRKFIVAFRLVAQTLSTLKTFSKFEWNDLANVLDEDEFLGYKSWYLYYYDLAKKDREKNVKTTLVDIDFNIELIRTDKINVVYILNLLKDVIKKDENEKKRSIDLILREIERSDNERLRAKQEMLKRFVTEKFFSLSPDEDIVKAYEEFEVQQQNMDIEMFAEETGIDVDTIKSFMSEYQFKHVISLEDIRKRLSQKGYGLLKTIKLSSEIEEFVKEQYEKFRAEGV